MNVEICRSHLSTHLRFKRCISLILSTACEISACLTTDGHGQSDISKHFLSSIFNAATTFNVRCEIWWSGILSAGFQDCNCHRFYSSGIKPPFSAATFGRKARVFHSQGQGNEIRRGLLTGLHPQGWRLSGHQGPSDVPKLSICLRQNVNIRMDATFNFVIAVAAWTHGNTARGGTTVKS